ncbi:TIGR01459 family HAD-type hydrolase [Marivita sp. S6314]|uniref:TIGR01459 family HAD-type hydrolase n=1 Tax=Marivita sp. S6314 TaxID=2926406 RepID=UPI001FF1E30E|nr:TIGR01459 family HAD-type hydrolase [Marivita sp. S6314]MCK0149208.1 TIGR01459 family HAD-type hydrolase [Marivita sp. S6314]
MQVIDSILTVADQFDAIVFDQFGVLHNGTSPYPHAIQALDRLRQTRCQLAVLSNSGKRADLNLQRITAMGFEPGTFVQVMTSGEAAWQDLHARQTGLTLFPITASQEDAHIWAGDLTVTFSPDIAKADAILLMGLPDHGDHTAAHAALDHALAHDLPVLCSNPDRAAPRADGKTVISPGTPAHAFRDKGGTVTFYGKPHLPVFDALQRTLNIKNPKKILMVGDSPEHDIAGAHTAGWSSLFISGGLHAGSSGNLFCDIAPPTYTLDTLK